MSRYARAVALVLLLSSFLLVSACGSSSTPSSRQSSQAIRNNETKDVEEQPSREDLLLDLKTASEVMDYVKDMDPEKRRRVLLEGAKRSGTPITVYTGMGENDVNRLSQAFERDIDDVSLEMWRAEGDIQLYTRAINEFRSNTPRADVINMKFNHSYDFNKEGMLTSYFTPQTELMPEGLYDPEGLWTGVYVLPINLTWNTERTSMSDTPTEWMQLADPKYRESFSLDVQDHLVLYYWRKVFGESEGTELARRIAENKPHMIRSRSQQIALLTAGEFDMAAAMYEHNTIQAMKKGAPLDFKYLDGPVLVDAEATMLMKRSPNPYGAILFMDWLLSQEGQQVIADMGRVSALSTVTYEDPRQGKVLQEKELFQLDPEEYGPLLEKTMSDFSSIFGLTQ